jgi:hypothetical protein
LLMATVEPSTRTPSCLLGRDSRLVDLLNGEDLGCHASRRQSWPGMPAAAE